ncbi:MAG TPA: hypothetical protein VLM89_00940 [Phycisphaerae bacterium]|nr:hypothetical protein [Phycisphaerae bacterium]
MSAFSRRSGCVAVAGLLLAVSGCDRKPPAVGPEAGRTPTTVQAEVVTSPRPIPPPDKPYNGLAWQIHHAKDAVEQARRLLPEIAEMGADTVLISNAGYQEHAGSETFQIDPAVTPTEQQWQDIFRIAHAHGLRVIFMPIILLSDPRGNEWRGVISPPNWDDWFEQYRDFILHFARLAQANKVEVFSVGSELVSTEKYTDRWRKLISDVRKVYSGRLTYSANWDHYKVVGFWDQLDLVGMTSYYKLSSEPRPSAEALGDAWKPIRRGILRWQKEVGKPLLFTEVGWASQEGASIEPWNYYYKQEATAAGLEEQRNCYRAFMETWGDAPQVGGMIWWEWTGSPGGPKDYNYTPRGKPAEKELRAWFARARNNHRSAVEAAAPADSTTPPTSRPANQG